MSSDQTGRPTRFHPTTRRAALQAGSIGLVGLGLADLFASRAAATATPVTPERSVIFIFLTGGLSHQDSFDLAATIFETLGIPPDAAWRDVDGRPYQLYRAPPIAGLM